MRKTLLAIACCLSAVFSAFAQTSRAPEDRPNIVVVFTDDHGYADLGAQGVRDDLKTPHIDQLAREGLRFTDGYVTAPQCVPSRAGIVSGRYQQRFGTDGNGQYPPPLNVRMLPSHLAEAGYATGMIGKWHLLPTHQQLPWLRENLPEAAKQKDRGPGLIPTEMKAPYFPHNRGFTEVFWGANNSILMSYDLEGNTVNPPERRHVPGYRLDIQSDAAVTFIDRHKDEPFFLYLAYYAPHVPLEATEEYLDRFPGDMPERRRYALAMIAAMDDGVGRMRETLKEHGILENTVFWFIGDNGAPLKIHKKDRPISFRGGAWDGSLNTPLRGEKGMLSEGGIRVPFVVSWPGSLAEGETYARPVIALDVGATAMALAGQDVPDTFDGVNLVPYLRGEAEGDPHDALFWRFWNQTAVRKGDWKLFKFGNRREMLFHLGRDPEETNNVIEDHPDTAAELKRELGVWADELRMPGVPNGRLNVQEKRWFEHYFPANEYE